MKKPVLIATIAVAIALVPLAICWNDMLVFSLAGLIPFCDDMKNGKV
jgi:hypothetical protein